MNYSPCALSIIVKFNEKNIIAQGQHIFSTNVHLQKPLH